MFILIEFVLLDTLDILDLPHLVKQDQDPSLDLPHLEKQGQGLCLRRDTVLALDPGQGPYPGVVTEEVIL